MTAKLFVDMLDRLTPKWLANDNAMRYLVSLIAPIDGMIEWLWQGVNARFPGRGPVQADGYIGRDRGIFRGPGESRAGWVARAKTWRQSHKRRGGPFGTLEQLAGYFAPNPPLMRIVTDSGHWYTRHPDGTEEVLAVSARPPAIASNWAWDANTGTRWFRYWVIIYSTGGVPWSKHKWGDGSKYGTPGLVWGSTMTKDEAVSIRAIVGAWNRAGAFCPNIIIAYDATLFDPSGSGAGYPNGTWLLWANRAQPASYLKGP